jgi:hypothetical protein
MREPVWGLFRYELMELPSEPARVRTINTADLWLETETYLVSPGCGGIGEGVWRSAT